MNTLRVWRHRIETLRTLLGPNIPGTINTLCTEPHHSRKRANLQNSSLEPTKKKVRIQNSDCKELLLLQLRSFEVLSHEKRSTVTIPLKFVTCLATRNDTEIKKRKFKRNRNPTRTCDKKAYTCVHLCRRTKPILRIDDTVL